MATEIEVTGLRELEAELLKLEGKVANKVVRKALRAGGQLVVTAARAKVPKKSGALRESIGLIARKGKGTNFQTMFVGTRDKNARALAIANKKRKKPLKGIFYGHIVEQGETVQRRTKAGANRGALTRPRPFLRPALDEYSEEVVEYFRRTLKKEIDNVARKSAP